jgi:hypothetical protein
MRILDPCEDESCNWKQGEQSYTNNSVTGGWLQMTSARWYPTVEILPDGDAFIVSGDVRSPLHTFLMELMGSTMAATSTLPLKTTPPTNFFLLAGTASKSPLTG